MIYLASWKYGLSRCRCVVRFRVIWTTPQLTFFAILLVQDKPTTYIFRKSKEYLLRCTCREPFDIVQFINIVHLLQPLKMANK